MTRTELQEAKRTIRTVLTSHIYRALRMISGFGQGSVFYVDHIGHHETYTTLHLRQKDSRFIVDVQVRVSEVDVR